MKQLTVVVGGQFGSEGKGAVTANLASQLGARDLNVRVGGPNAGHTAYDSAGREWKLRQVPVGVVTSECQLMIGPGSEIDLPVLLDEVTALDKAGHNCSDRLTIHASATLIQDVDKKQEGYEALVDRIGSTGKGIGAARSRRIMRTAPTVSSNWDEVLEAFRERGGVLVPPMISTQEIDQWLPGRVLVEGTQGFGLGLHTGFYPFTTSSDCRAVDFLSMAGISPWHPRYGGDVDIYVVARVYPIRVAGNSGPLFGETSWEALNLEPERTTVTNKVRRVGEWDPQLVRRAVNANGASQAKIVLTMLDQMFPKVKGLTEIDRIAEIDPTAQHFIKSVAAQVGAPVVGVGTSPTTIAWVK